MKYILSCFFVLFSTAIFSQDMFSVHQRSYQQALKYYDYQAATQSLYAMMVIKPEREDLKDSLANLFFAGQRYVQAYFVSEEILKKEPGKNNIREILALSKQNLGLSKESLGDYEILWASEKKLYYLYQICILQYQLKRINECLSSLELLISQPNAINESVNIRNQGDRSQDVPMKAAAYNIKGICAMEMNLLDLAQSSFDLALDAFPQFELAAANRDVVQQQRMAQQQTSNPSTVPAETTPPSNKKKKK